MKTTNDPINPTNLSGYPLYPDSEDIYNKYKEEQDVNPEEISKKKEFTKNDMLGGDIDVPGSELDDEQENIGNEDEENNFYSLGSDNHYDLEEDKV